MKKQARFVRGVCCKHDAHAATQPEYQLSGGRKQVPGKKYIMLMLLTLSVSSTVDEMYECPAPARGLPWCLAALEAGAKRQNKLDILTRP